MCDLATVVSMRMLSRLFQRCLVYGRRHLRAVVLVLMLATVVTVAVLVELDLQRHAKERARLWSPEEKRKRIDAMTTELLMEAAKQICADYNLPPPDPNRDPNTYFRRVDREVLGENANN